MKAHCLFEQSGTFKNEFKKLGIESYDYDIMNDYGETDFQIDLFNEIETAYGGGVSIFDKITPDDLIMAFFPCIRFENQIMLSFRGQMHGMEKWSYKQKMIHCMKLLGEVKHNYDLVNKLFIICIDRGLRLVMENPYSEEHFLRRYWCYPPSIIDKDRTENGDYYPKPTQFWFCNMEPKQNLVFEPVEYNAVVGTGKGCNGWVRRTSADWKKTGAKNVKQARSMIHPQYANRFIRMYLIDQ